MFEVKGKVALVTGGAQGIGLNIVKELLRNGVKGVSLIDTNSKQGEIAVEQLTKEFSGGRVIYLNADVSEKSQFEEAFEETIRTFEQLDIVINNAGIIHELQWDKCIAVNLQGCVTGTLLALHKYFPKSLGVSEGIILNMSSLAGIYPIEILPVYSGTKHGVVGFSRAVSGSCNSKNVKVKVIVICPGTTSTVLATPSEHQVGKESSEVILQGIGMIPAQTPEELASHVVPIMKEGETGSVWLVDLNTRTQVEFPTFIPNVLN